LHPYGTHWDEAQYLNEVAIDSQRLRAGLLAKVAGRILIKSWGRPPAYRILALPFLAVAGYHTTLARLVTLACFLLSAWFIYLATKRIAGELAGTIAVLTFCLSPQVVAASMWFSSEGPLYLAMSSMFYFLFAGWTDDPERSKNWIGLGLSLGLGLLSKASFVLIGLPVLGFAFLVDRWKPMRGSSSSLLKSGLLSLLIAGPWWVLNLKSSVAYAGYARGFVRNSLGSPSLATWILWFCSVVEALLGFGLSLVILIVVAIFIRQWMLKRDSGLTSLQTVGIGACAFGGLPIVVAQLLGTNHLLRHISPSMIPLAIVVGTMAGTIEWSSNWTAMAVLGTLYAAQLGVLIAPLFVPNQNPVDAGLRNGSLPGRIMSRYEQWDWGSVQQLSDQCGLQVPMIAYLGNGRAFNDPQIQFPWVVKGSAPSVTWLWRYEDGPIDWHQVLDQTEKSDLVITAPGYVGDVSNGEDLDNQHNSELAERLSRDSDFMEPIHLHMGRFQPVDVVVFLNRKLTCRIPPRTATSP
jgi:hypothetical protein